MKELYNKVALITGSASGIGKSCAELFLSAGAKVILADINQEEGALLYNLYPKDSLFISTNVCLEEDWEQTINKSVAHFGRLDCLINNAAIAGVSGPIDQIPASGFQDTMDVLLKGVFLGMKHASRIMKKQASGTIINMASIAGIRSCYSTHTYSAAKAAIIHLTKTAAVELGEYGIRVNAISPGPVLNSFIPKALGLSEKEAQDSLQKIHSLFASTQPLKKACLPEDIAQAALWLSSDFSKMVNGHNLVVDGGASCGILMPDKISFFKNMKSLLNL